MLATLAQNPIAAVSSVPVWRRLPACMRLLYIAARPQSADWLVEAFASDSASKVIVEEAAGTAAGLARLRDEVFDAILVSHEPAELDALDLVEGYRAGGADEPIIVLGAAGECEMAALCYEVGADGYVCVQTTTRNLIWIIGRAIQRHQLAHDNQRLSLAEENRRQREHEETACMLQQQRALLVEPSSPLPAELIEHYRELLRTYVIMGSGNLADELRALAEMFVGAGLSAQQIMQLHLHVLEELIRGLGKRSTRHIMIRADLLVMELLLHLANGYRRSPAPIG